MKLLNLFRWLNRPERVSDPMVREALVRGPIAVAPDGSVDRSLTIADVRRFLNGLKTDYRVSLRGFPFIATFDGENGEAVTALCLPVDLEPYRSDFADEQA